MGFLPLPVYASTQTIYASPTGSSTKEGSTEARATTLANALAIAQDGDTVFLLPGIYDSPENSYFDASGIDNLTLTGSRDAVIRIPEDGRTGTENALGIGNQSNLKVENITIYAEYNSTFSLLFMGGGTLTNARFEGVLFMGDTWDLAGSQSYMANLTGTSAGDIEDLGFYNCRFVNTLVGGAAQMSGLLIRGFYGLSVESCTFVNINNPIVPDNVFQKYNLRYVNNEEVYEDASINIEGPDLWGINGIVYTGCVQRVAPGVTVVGGTNFGGVLLDSGNGIGSSNVAITGNRFIVNPIQFSAVSGAGNSIADVVIVGNVIEGTRSTANVNHCIAIHDDPKADGTSKNILIRDNLFKGTYTGDPTSTPTGWTNLRIGPNMGDTRFDSAQEEIATLQSSSATSYGDLTTVGPDVDVWVPFTGKVRVTLACGLWQDTAGNGAYMGCEVSGASSVSPTDIKAVYSAGPVAGSPEQASSTFELSGLTPGLCTFRAKYRAGAGTNANFNNRRITVEPVLQ